MLESLEDLLAKGRALADPANHKPSPCVGGCGLTLLPPIRVCEACEARRSQERRIAEILKGVPASYHWATFESPDLPSRVKSSQAIARAKSLRDAPRVVLVGAAGVGKTSLAVAMMLKRCALSTVDAAFIPAWKLGLSRARSEDSDTGLVGKALRAELLVLDDLGSERNVPSNPVPDVVFERHAEARSTWVTTWMSPADLATRYGDGIARRVFEKAAIIECGVKL